MVALTSRSGLRHGWRQASNLRQLQTAAKPCRQPTLRDTFSRLSMGASSTAPLHTAQRRAGCGLPGGAASSCAACYSPESGRPEESTSAGDVPWLLNHNNAHLPTTPRTTLQRAPEQPAARLPVRQRGIEGDAAAQ